MSGYIHGGTDSREVQRLETQAEWVQHFAFPSLVAHPGDRVLDLATGVGAMAARLARWFPGTQVLGVDLSAAQLAAARANHPELPVARARGEALPFPDASFDVVHCSWLLEHLSDPVPVLREVRRVLRPGGRCQFIEVENSSFATTPPFEEVQTVMRALNEAQVRAGGDPFVGQRLHHHFRAAGFERFDIRPFALEGTAADPEFRARFVGEFVEIFESLDEVLGEQLGATLATAIEQLRSLATRPDGVLRYRGAIAQGAP